MTQKQRSKDPEGNGISRRSLSRRLIAVITRRGSADSTASTASTRSSTDSAAPSTAAAAASTAASTDPSDAGDEGGRSGSRRRRSRREGAYVEQVIKTDPVEEELLCDYLSEEFGVGNFDICLRTDTYYLKIPRRLVDAEIRSCCI